MVIIFQNEKARKHLLEKGIVYTFRTKKAHKFGKDWMTDHRGGKKIADVVIRYSIPIDAYGLQQFVEDSGFSSWREWIETIKQLHPKLKTIRGYLWGVELTLEELQKRNIMPL